MTRTEENQITELLLVKHNGGSDDWKQEYDGRPWGAKATLESNIDYDDVDGVVEALAFNPANELHALWLEHGPPSWRDAFRASRLIHVVDAVEGFLMRVPGLRPVSVQCYKKGQLPDQYFYIGRIGNHHMEDALPDAWAAPDAVDDWLKEGGFGWLIPLLDAEFPAA